MRNRRDVSDVCTLRPTAFRARTALSRPGPGPFTITSTDFRPNSCRGRSRTSLATGVKPVLIYVNHETRSASRRQKARYPAISDRDNGVVERGVNVNNALSNLLFDLLTRCVTLCHQNSLLTNRLTWALTSPRLSWYAVHELADCGDDEYHGNNRVHQRLIFIDTSREGHLLRQICQLCTKHFNCSSDNEETLADSAIPVALQIA